MYTLASKAIHVLPGIEDAFLPEEQQGSLSFGPDAEGLFLAGSEASRAVWIPTAALVLTYPDPTEPEAEFEQAAEVLQGLAGMAESEFAAAAWK